MSLILDALKKLDREKAFIRKVTGNIADEILKPDPVRPRRKVPLYFAGGLLSVCLTAALTYVVTVNLGLLTRPAPPAATGPAESAPPPEPAREAREEVALPSPKARSLAENKKKPDLEALPMRQAPAGVQTTRTPDPAAALREPGRAVKEDSSLLSAKVRNRAEDRKASGADSQPVPKSTLAKETGPASEPPPPAQERAKEAKSQDSFAVRTPSPAEKRTGPGLSPEGTEAAPAVRKTAESGPAQPGGSAPALRLTGIVWSEDPSGRCAVVNGAIVSEGAEIQGIKVVEILPNRVRFLDRGRPFELQLF